MTNVVRRKFPSEPKREIPTSEKIPVAVRPLFPDPTIEGEDPNDYWAVVSFVIDEKCPSSLSEWMLVRDSAKLRWRHARCERLIPRLFDLDRRDAVATLAAPFPSGNKDDVQFQGDCDDAHELAHKASRPATKKQAAVELHRLGISPDSIAAKSFVRHLPVFEALERMSAYLGARINNVSKDFEECRQRRCVILEADANPNREER